MKGVQFFSQFCEDVRQEADKRVSLMGLYPPVILSESKDTVSQLRICVQASVHIPASAAEAGVKMIVAFNDAIIRDMPIPESVLKQVQARKEESSAYLSLSFVSDLTNSGIDDFGVLESYLLIGEQRFEGNSLRIVDKAKAGIDELELPRSRD